MSIEFLEIHRRKEVSNMKTTGEKIRDLRLNLGLTQAELAEMTGITVRSITNYETDAATPRRLQLRKLCEALNVTEDYLLKPEIDDPTYGLDTAPYVNAARERYGSKGAIDMKALLDANRALFAGGEMPQEDKDLFFQAVTEAYFECKKQAHDKFTPEKYRK